MPQLCEKAPPAPRLKAFTEQVTWRVKYIRSSNYRSYSSPETAAAELRSSKRTQQSSLVPTFLSWLKQGLIDSEIVIGAGPTVGRWKENTQ